MLPSRGPMWSSVTEDLVDRLSQTAEKACWAKQYIAASVQEGATREEVRAFGRLAPVATQDAAGLLHQPQRMRLRTSLPGPFLQESLDGCLISKAGEGVPSH